MLGSTCLVLQAPLQDSLAFDPFPLPQNGRAASEVDVSWSQVAQALVVALVIVVRHKGRDLGL